MKHYYDLVFCIDKKYNKQAFLSIVSFYKTNSNFNNKIFIIHKSPYTFNKYIKKIKNLFPKCKLEVVKFKFNIKDYPNLKSAHVSEATYYRMFIADHINSSHSFIIYIDADAFFLKDISKDISNIILNLESKNVLLSAKTEYVRDEAIELFTRLEIKQKYFNAGIMIINFEKWKNENTTEMLKKKVIEMRSKINYWDQDVLNVYVNGEYEELPLELNFTIDISHGEQKIPNNTKILHYAGKSKPWDKTEKKMEYKTYYKELEKLYFM